MSVLFKWTTSDPFKGGRASKFHVWRKFAHLEFWVYNWHKMSYIYQYSVATTQRLFYLWRKLRVFLPFDSTMNAQEKMKIWNEVLRMKALQQSDVPQWQKGVRDPRPAEGRTFTRNYGFSTSHSTKGNRYRATIIIQVRLSIWFDLWFDFLVFILPQS